jgi:hypothetical protein
MSRPARPGEVKSARSSHQFSRFCYLKNPDKVFGTDNNTHSSGFSSTAISVASRSTYVTMGTGRKMLGASKKNANAGTIAADDIRVIVRSTAARIEAPFNSTEKRFRHRRAALLDQHFLHLADKRTGRSTPAASIGANATEYLREGIGRIREQRGIKPWPIAAASRGKLRAL